MIRCVEWYHMNIQIRGSGPAAPLQSAADLFETEHTLDRPVEVMLRDDPDVRTKTGHRSERHILEMSRSAASSAMATELAVHEFAHMYRHEEGHPSHHQSTAEIISLALTGRTVDRETVAHTHQIANHMKDIYADDLTLRVTGHEKLLRYLEAGLAAALRDRPQFSRPGTRLTGRSAPAITAVNAAFALALIERHDLDETEHRLYDLAAAAASDAPVIPLDRFTELFRSLQADPSPREYRRVLIEATRIYAGARSVDGTAAD